MFIVVSVFSLIKGAGVGVLAIKDIPLNVNPFSYPNDLINPLHKKIFRIHTSEYKNLSPDVHKFINDFFNSSEKNIHELPAFGLNSLDISFYLNHNLNNNLDIVYIDDKAYNNVVTNRLIKKGEELFINYDNF